MREPPLPLPRNKVRLATVIKTAGDVVRIEHAQHALGVSRIEAAKLLSRWAAQNWVRRIGPGAYVPVPIDLLDSPQVVEDPWILVPALFAPAYIGGRTAAEHWGLTEQIFRDILVYTARPLRLKSVESQATTFTLKHVRQSLIFGTKAVWRSQTRVLVSDVHRTIIDMLNDPAVAGGIQHAADCLAEYLRRPDRAPDILIDYTARVGNGAVLKRLGFLVETDPDSKELADTCKQRLTKGNAVLDPSQECTRLVTRWRLWIPESWTRGANP